MIIILLIKTYQQILQHGQEKLFPAGMTLNFQSHGPMEEEFKDFIIAKHGTQFLYTRVSNHFLLKLLASMICSWG